MPRREDLTNKKFGRLTVIRFAHSQKGQSIWECLCECGNTTYVSAGHLKSGHTTSCGCAHHHTPDLTGIRFGRLLVVKRAESDKDGNPKWICQCDCGNITEVYARSLRSGDTISCGCYRSDMLKELREYRFKHGYANTRLYDVFQGMHSRCTNTRNSSFKNYGAIGVKVCDEWSDFTAFKDWALSNGYDESLPSKECTLDRIDPFGNYEPCNCRWISMKEQLKNKRDTKRFEFNEHFYTISELAEIAGLSQSTISRRIKRGWDIEKTVMTPSKRPA